MKDHRLNRRPGWLGVMIFLMLATLVFSTSGRKAASAEGKPPWSFIVERCEADLARRLNVPADNIEAEAMIIDAWPDTSLGLPKIGYTYAQQKTSGWTIWFRVRGERYFYAATRTSYRYAGPASSWKYSLLYLQPKPDEPNLNEDLYQCSLLGTNTSRLLPGVTDFYPQENGIVMVKRRTSRSSHDLLYVKADEPEKSTLLYKAFDFGHASVDSGGQYWAGYVRQRVGEPWTVVVARLVPYPTEMRIISLPDGTKPHKLAWDGRTLMALIENERGTEALQISPQDESPGWQPIGTNSFPGMLDLVLSKSHSLEVVEVEQDGKPGVEVATVWFTGSREVIATIPNLALRSYELLGPYVLVWGERNSKAAAYAVSMSSGEALAAYPGAVRNIKAFSYPPRTLPMGPQ